MAELNDASAKPETEVKEPITDDSLLGNPEQNKPVVDPVVDAPKPDEPKEDLLSEADKEAKKTEEAENKRLLETDDEKLSEEEKTKKAEVIKTQGEVKAKEEADKKLKEVPEKYEFTVPDGMTVDQPLVDKVSPILKKLKASQEDAQELVSAYAEHMKTQGDAQSKSFDKFVADSKTETIQELGPEYKKELSFAAKARGRLLSAETIGLLNASGLSNNVNFIKDLIRIGRSISEDVVINGKPGPVGSQTLAEKIYGKGT